MFFRFFLLGFVAASAVATGASAQQARVVVLGFSGADGSTARIQVVRGLKGRADFETRSQAERVVEDRRLDLRREADRAALAEALQVDYLFWGRVRGRGQSARTEIRVAGREGATLTGYEAGAPGTSKGNRLIQQAARTALAEAVELSPPRPTKPAASVAPRAVVPVAEAAVSTGAGTRPPEPVEKATPRKNQRDLAEEEKSKQRKSDDRRKAKTGELPVFEILVGGGVRFRNIDFNVGDGSGGTENRGFDSGAYAEVGGYVLVRPLGRWDKAPLQAIVIQGDGGVGFGLKAGREGTGITSGIRTWRALGQVGYLHPIRRLQVGGLVGVGVDTFEIDVNSVLPSIQYIYARVGGALAYTIIRDFLAFRVDGGFRKPFSLGDLDQAFGNNSSAIGWDATATVGGRLGIGFSYAFRFVYEAYKLDFAGATSNVPSMGGPGGDGNDRALTFWFLVGWTL